MLLGIFMDFLLIWNGISKQKKKEKSEVAVALFLGILQDGLVMLVVTFGVRINSLRISLEGKTTMIKKIIFWIFTIAVGFVNPLLTIVLIVLYYLPKIIQDIYNSEKVIETFGIKSYSNDVLEEMK